MVECTSYRSDGSGDETVLKYQSGSEAVPIFLGNLKKKKKTVRTTHAAESPRCHLCPPAHLLISAIFDLARYHCEQKEYLCSQLHPPVPASVQDKNATCRSYLGLDGKLKQLLHKKKGKGDAIVCNDQNHPLTREHLHRPINMTCTRASEHLVNTSPTHWWRVQWNQSIQPVCGRSLYRTWVDLERDFQIDMVGICKISQWQASYVTGSENAKFCEFSPEICSAQFRRIIIGAQDENLVGEPSMTKESKKSALKMEYRSNSMHNLSYSSHL